MSGVYTPPRLRCRRSSMRYQVWATTLAKPPTFYQEALKDLRNLVGSANEKMRTALSPHKAVHLSLAQGAFEDGRRQHIIVILDRARSEELFSCWLSAQTYYAAFHLKGLVEVAYNKEDMEEPFLEALCAASDQLRTFIHA